MPIANNDWHQELMMTKITSL